MPTVFLSYARADLPLIEQLEAQLRNHPEISIWRDQEKIYGGQKWPKVLGEAIAKSDLFLLAWSQSAAELHFVEFEWNTAIALKKTIIPCLLDNTLLPDLLKPVQSIPVNNIQMILSAFQAHAQAQSGIADTTRHLEVINNLGRITTVDPQEALRAAKQVFAQHQLVIGGKVSQAGGDIHLTTVAPTSAKPVSCAGRVRWWQFWKRRDHSTSLSFSDSPFQKGQDPSEPEPVLLGASAPQNVLRGQTFTARFVAYAQAAEEAVGKMLASLGPGSAIHLALKTCRWKSGTDVVVHLSGQYLEVQCSKETFKWEGGYNLVDFDVSVASNAPLGITTLKYDVSIHDVIVARVRLDIEISHLQNSRTARTASICPAQTAFASYASQDSSRVLDRVAAIRISAGLDVFVDCLAMNPGEHWKSRLRQEICQRDLFLLFWSRHAKESPWMSWEWHTALAEKDEPALQLHPLETPQEAPPPDELKHLHFGDPTILARRALEQQ